MGFLDRVIDSYKFLDKNGLKKAFELIKKHDYHWTGTHAEYKAQKDNIPAYAILHFTDDYEDSVGVVDKIEDNNMNGVTSNAVYDALKVTTGTLTKPENIQCTIYDCKYIQFGKVVVVYIFISFTSGIAASTDYVVGLPKAAANATTQLSMTGSTSSSDSLRAYIQSGGTSIRNQDKAMLTVETYSGQLVYICQ